MMFTIPSIMLAKDRYVHLFSNAEPAKYSNRANDFTNTIHPPLHFDPNEKWEVALQEVSCVNTLENVPQDLSFLTTTKGASKVYQEQKYTIPRGVYEAESLLSALNKNAKGFTFSYLSGVGTIKRIRLVLDPQTTKIEFDPLLADILSLPSSNITESTRGTMPINLKAFSYNMLVYVEFIEESAVGGQREKILRVIPYNEDKYLALVSKEFIHPTYLGVTHHQLDRIHVKLMTDYGSMFPLHDGRTYLKLHFRRKV